MSQVTINVNGLSLVHEDSGGVSTATLPDVCLTPGAGAVPYPNVALSRDLAGGASLVRADGGHRIAVAGSSCARSTGGEPGTGGGVTSGVSGQEATFLTHSFDVTIEGRGACRLTDKMLHNRGNTINCGGKLQNPVKGGARGADPARKTTKPPAPKATLPPLDQTRHKRHGLDTNLGSDPTKHTLNTAYARSRKRTFVGRYLIAFPHLAFTVPQGVTDGNSPPQKLIKPLDNTSNGLNPGLTLDEANTLITGEVSVFAIWEITKYRAIESGTVKGQHELGRQDALMAKQQIAWCGGEGRPIYFTVDFTAVWKARAIKMVNPGDGILVPELLRHSHPQAKAPLTGDLIESYFRGINSVLDPSRVGVYGTYWTIKNLLDLEYAQWGWQQAFDNKAKSQGGKVDNRVRLTQDNIEPNQDPDPTHSYIWGVNGGGALDFDSTKWADFGQWDKVHVDTTGGAT